MGVITKKTTIAGVLASLLVGGKLALMAVPNIEIVTILLATAGFVFGPFVAVLAAFSFVAVETMLWGLSAWVVSYLIYWPMVAFCFSLFKKAWAKRASKNQNIVLAVCATALAAVLTLSFGVLTSLIDVGLLTGNFDDFWQKFALMYVRGIVFFALHVGGNIAIFAVGFVPLTKLMSDINRRMFPSKILGETTKEKTIA